LLKKLVALFVIGFFVWGFCKGQVTFQKTYGGPANDVAYAVRQTPSGGYILAGTTASITGSNDVYVIKTDSSGNIVWAKTYGGLNSDIGSSIESTADGAYLVVGTTSSFGSGTSNMYVLKIDSTGNVIWSKTYGSGNESGSCLLITATGFIAVGLSYRDVFLVKADNNGDTLLVRTLGNRDEILDYAYDVRAIKATQDSNYIITGSSHSSSSAADRAMNLKVDTNFNSVWMRIFTNGVSANYSLKSIIPTSDGSYIIAGGGTHSVYGKLDSAGVPQWTRWFETNSTIQSMIQTSDSNYVMLGFGTFLIKIDSLGDTLWTKHFNSSLNYEIRQTRDGGYIILAQSHYSVNSGIDIVLIKSDSSGNFSSCLPLSDSITIDSTYSGGYLHPVLRYDSCEIFNAATIITAGGIINDFCSSVDIQYEINDVPSETSIYPNPFTHSLTIQSHSAGKKEIILFDVTGKEILRQQTSVEEIKLNTEGIAAGFYLLKVGERNFKVIKEQ
jgi:hypothetical protein